MGLWLCKYGKLQQFKSLNFAACVWRLLVLLNKNPPSVDLTKISNQFKELYIYIDTDARFQHTLAIPSGAIFNMLSNNIIDELSWLPNINSSQYVATALGRKVLGSQTCTKKKAMTIQGVPGWQICYPEYCEVGQNHPTSLKPTLDTPQTFTNGKWTCPRLPPGILILHSWDFTSWAMGTCRACLV